MTRPRLVTARPERLAQQRRACARRWHDPDPFVWLAGLRDRTNPDGSVPATSP